MYSLIYSSMSYDPCKSYISVRLITICAVVKSKCTVEQDKVWSKKCRDSGQNDDLCADHQVLCGSKSCLKYALDPQIAVQQSATCGRTHAAVERKIGSCGHVF